jgi:hypothetical protein
MHLRLKFALLLVLVLAFVPGVGSAYACGGDHSSGTAYAAEHRSGAGVFFVAKNYLGLSFTQLKSDLRDGKSLADIANATPGKSASGLVDAITTALQTKLDAWVTAGKLSSTREASILANASTKIEKLVNLKWTHTSWWRHDDDRR